MTETLLYPFFCTYTKTDLYKKLDFDINSIQIQRKTQEIRQCDKIYGTIRNRWFDTEI